MARRKLRKELVAEIALRFVTIVEFQKADPSAYSAARRNGWLSDVCSHMAHQHRSLNKEIITQIAKKFHNRTDFKSQDSSAYNAAINLGILDEVCEHMQVLHRDWDKHSLHELAKMFESRTEFQRTYGGAYTVATRNGWLDEICGHMQPKRRSLTKEDIITIAKRFHKKIDFVRADGAAYGKAISNGWLDEVCAHMKRGYSGFNVEKAAYVYQIEFLLPNGEKVWKVGITNRNPETRLKYMGIPDWAIHNITHALHYENGSDARKEEIRLHSIGAHNGTRYEGDPFLGNGNTELFSAPLITD